MTESEIQSNIDAFFGRKAAARKAFSRFSNGFHTDGSRSLEQIAQRSAYNANVWTEIRIDAKNAKRIRNGLEYLKTFSKSFTRNALNEAADNARKKIVDRLYGAVNLPFATIDAGVSVAKRATSNDQSAIVRISGKQHPLADFGAWQDAEGVHARVMRQGVDNFYDSAFFATMPDGTYGVFEREWIGGERADRLPLEAIQGASLAQAVRDNPSLETDIHRDASTAFAESMVNTVTKATSEDGVGRLFDDLTYLTGF